MAAGFYWGANNPYLRSIWVRARRAPKGLNPAIAMIGPDANPAHIIFECMTNRDWGMGASFGIFNISSFEVCAQTLYDEAFGLSLQWTRSTTIEAFVTEIIDHIHATLFVDPRTGLMTLKLLRDDFDYDSLRVITPSNARLTNFQRKLWGETSNELIVTFTNPINEGEETVGAQDLANISMQGGVISNGRNYYAIRNKELAARVAERDLRAASMPLATSDVEIDRTAWDLIPGEVVKLSWPEKNIAELVVRVGVINYGRPGAGLIKTTLYEDIFSLARAQYLAPPATSWVDPSEDPAPLDYQMILTAPAFIAASALALTSPSDLIYPEVISVVFAAPDSQDDLDFELIGQTALTTGDLVYTSFGARHFVGGATLAADVPAEVETTITSFNDATGGSPLTGTFVLLGDGGDEDVEIALVKEVTEAGWVLTRGVLDTVPRAWTTGTRVWSVPEDLLIADTTLRAEGETPDYRLLTRTSRGLLAFDDADPVTPTLSARPHLPNRPANVKVNDVGFGSLDASGLSSLNVTWANRNRLQETSQILAWNNASVSPESGQTTTIEVMDGSGTVLNTIAGLVGTSYSLSLAAFEGESAGRVRVKAERDGFESIQAHEISITNLVINQELSGALAGSATLTADLKVATALAGSIAGSSSTSGSMDVRAELAGGIAATGALTGNIGTASTLAGDTAVLGTFTGNLTVTP